ncbi:MAG: trehalose-phosphatase [Deltaproteobacteria bacterium]
MNDYLFQRLDYIKNQITGERISLFLDFDGTLTPIVSRPEKAFLSYQMKDIVQRLCNICKVAIVSGREIGTVKRFV